MKKIIITLGLWFLVTGLWAQQDDGARIVAVSQAIQSSTVTNTTTTNYTLQVGVPFLGQNFNTPERKVNPFDVRYPWDVLYLFPTFTEENFDVSKGYFGDKILINWDLRANFDIINSIKIYRRQYREYTTLQEDKDHAYSFVASVSKSENSYEDEYVEGGVLYQYKVVAEGISETETIYSNYISGIGYRSPTAVVTGNVSYKGGNPVKDVIVRANSDGSSVNSGSSLLVPASSSVKVENINNPITNAATLQAWVKPQTPFSANSAAINLFELSDVASNTFNITANLLASSNTLVVNIGSSEFRLENYFPSGKLNSKGEDLMIPIADFNTSFVHFTVAISDGNVPSLYINGRKITEAYKDEVNTKLVDDPNYTAPFFNVTIPTQTNTLSIGGNPTTWNAIDVGGGKGSFLDEIRIWKDTLGPALIRTDYTRYISGNDSRMVSYLTANEKVGAYAYDLSRNGFEYNKNHGKLYELNTPAANKVVWATGTGNFPKADQLGILGVTDINGNYEITAIPYSGTGESFNITPLYGVHQFEPGQQLVFLGEGSEVVNKVDFLDVSSFSFKGKILFDTRGVFKSFVETEANAKHKIDYYLPSDVDATREGYNFYQTYNDGKLDKGEYWYNEVTDRYEKYATIYSNDVNVYVDGNIVFDKNNVPIVSKSEDGLSGYFDIQVPIGNHFITVKKDGHEFKYGGRFPAESGTFKEFFEDSNEAVIFVDSTRVTVVGKVVGGSVEAAKAIGFGDQGLFQKQVDIDGESETLTISSKNNIGVANITFGYKPPGFDISTAETEFNFETNEESGEYRVSVMPLKYTIGQEGGLTIKSNSDISILEGDETLNIAKVPDTIIPQFEYPDKTFEFGESYHYEKSFPYRTTAVLKVIEQTSDPSVTIDGTKISTQGFEYPIYTQFGNYEIKMQSFERYINKDSGSDVEDIVPIIDGEFKPTNNLAFLGSETLERDKDDESIQIYKFKGGMPSISPPFTRTIDLRFRINGVDYEAENYVKKGIILGGQSDGSQTFLTSAPDIPDIILRDPPGSNSSASIQKGESITFSTEAGVKASGGLSENLKISHGMILQTGGGLVGPVVKSETINNTNVNLSVTTSSKDAKSVTKTYKFDQTISTSDDPKYVGAEGDLYIGQSRNYYYGSYDNVQSSNSQIGTSISYVLTNSKNESVHISKQKAMYFTEEPSETFFVLSQKYILSTLIPELELIIYNLDNGIISEDDDGVVDRAYYDQQINLWRKVILENERSKYRSLKDRNSLKAEVDLVIDNFINELSTAIDDANVGAGGGGYEDRLKNKLNSSQNLQTLIDERFIDNISFDAGVGEVTRSVETSIVKQSSTDFNVKIDQSVAVALGFEANAMGFTFTTSGFASQELNASLSEEEVATVNLSYTLKDNDPANALSVDVINLFDGNGPIFSTIGGRTSCPYEGPELTYFYNHSDYNPDAIVIPLLPEDKREELSYATQRVEVPLLSVEVAEVTNVPERNNAEYTLLLENNSVTETDVYFELFVDNLSNPNNALINIEQNGTIVFVPYGQKVEYSLTLGKSISDVYDYEDIRIILQSRCDANVFDDVLISANFVPSCSEVEVTAPLTNWVYNNKTAYNIDESVNPLQVKLASFDTSFNSFKKLDLEYRLASSPTWTRLQTYYTTQEFYNEALESNETEIALIDSPELIYALDVIGLQLSDGDYELRARSTCTNDTEYISDVVTGRVDLTSPQKFGTPLPIDGILGIGEDLKVSFNEPIFYNSAISTIEIKGQTNQLPINHNVSLYFEGASNTAVVNKPKITKGDFTLEFWMNNSTTAGTADIIKQEGGLSIGLNNGEIVFTLGGITAKGGIANDGLYHHYTFTHKNSTGEISIFQDDTEIVGATGAAEVDFTNNNPLVIGGNSFIGNMHELRIWNKSITLENAYAKMYDKLIGNEANLVGYWPMDEGRSNIAKDLARYKHADVNAAWDIKPKGTSYDFNNGQYLTLDNTGFVQLTNEMDATISFWVKTDQGQEATIFSNGKGDGSDIVQSNGRTNKWAINMTNSGMLTFESEGNSYVLTSEPVADNNWHHITLLFNRIGSLRTYVDAAQVSSNLMADIGGFSGNKIWLGARGSTDLGGNVAIDRPFTGKIDEFRLWNTLRNVEQISRDRFNEVSIESIGLVLYAKMNAPDPENGNAPSYYHADVNETIAASLAVLSAGEVNYNNDVPPIKPERELLKFEVNKVINGDEMILEPVVTDWASLEGQILDITVHRMFDSANNRQQSPITWTAYVKRNEVSWFAEGYNEIVDIEKYSGEEKTFEISLINKGGKGQPYNISNVPRWLKLSSYSGTLQPDSKITLTATIDKELTAGEYLENLYLQTDFGFDEKLQIKLRVLEQEPDWNINPTDFDYSMNIVGRVKIDSKFSEDSYDKVGAFFNGEVRGSGDLVYSDAFKEYFVYLTVYSNVIYGENIEFSIWDASKGKIVEAVIDGSTTTIFKENEVMGSLSNPVIFENSNILVQEIELNKGWTWVSLNVDDTKFSNLNALTQGMNLKTDDRMLSHSPSALETYYKDESVPSNSTWSGTISGNGGMSTSKMYKVRFSEAQTLSIKGAPVNVATWSFPVKENWNWLPYPLAGNQSTNEALAYFDAVDGDVIKSQNLFAIYDPINGWNGTLNYLVSGTGYMIKSSSNQTFTYPNYLAKPNGNKPSGTSIVEAQPKIESKFMKYAENMNAVVQLPEGFNEVFIYDEKGVLRGQANNQDVNGKELSFITIYGDIEDGLVFYVGDGRNERITTKRISFKGNNVLGTVEKPVVLEVFSDNLAVYPNPFEKDLTIRINALENQKVLIQLFSMTGQLVFSQEKQVETGTNWLKISPSVASGTYLLQVKKGGETLVSKVVKN
jgi:hypothetical protein